MFRTQFFFTYSVGTKNTLSFGNILFLGLGADDMGVFIWGKFIELHTYDVCISLYGNDPFFLKEYSLEHPFNVPNTAK